MSQDGFALTRARRRLLARHLPAFAAFWLPAVGLWTFTLWKTGHVGPLAGLGGMAIHALILCVAIILCRRDPAGPHVLPVVLGACILVALTTTVRFALVGGDADFLAYIHLMLYLLAALCFTWGWRPELALWSATVIPYLIVLPRLPVHVHPSELSAAIISGSVICFAIAEGASRAFTAQFHHRRAEERGRQELEASRNAYRDLAELASEPIFTTDAAGCPTRAVALTARAPARALFAYVKHPAASVVKIGSLASSARSR